MKAIVQEGYGSADVLHLREIAQPAVPDDGVLVRIHAASVNAMDCHFLHGALPVRLMMGLRRPKVPVRGVDLAGQVETVGKSVTRFKPGDEVFGSARGTFAEYAVAVEDRLAPKPQRLTFEQAAAIPVAGLTALQGLRDRARVQPGQRVLIHGAGGGVGTFAVQIAKALGAHVTAVTGPDNVDLVRSLGPDEVIDYTREDFARRSERYDVFFDVAAHRPLADCRRVLMPGGTLVMAGAPKGGVFSVVARLLGVAVLSRFARPQQIGLVSAKVKPQDLAALAELTGSGKVTPAIDRTYSLEQVPDAFRYAGGGRARAKVVIRVGGGALTTA